MDAVSELSVAEGTADAGKTAVLFYRKQKGESR
jgi:hypothetical protein